MGSAFPSFSSGRGYEDDDVDHRPDGRTLEDLRQGVRDELVKNDLIERDADADETIELQKATQELALASGGGIADEQGLGWAGKSWRIVGSCFRAHVAAKNTKRRLNATPEQQIANVQVLSSAIRTVLECIGEDPDREGLLRTPERYAKALLWMTKGYEERLVDVINDAVFAEDHDEMVIVRDIDVFSLCEHHMVPFTGKVSSAFHHTFCGAHRSDLHWVHSQQARPRTVQARSYRRDILASIASARAVDQASRPCGRGGDSTSWCCRRHGGSVSWNMTARQNRSVQRLTKTGTCACPCEVCRSQARRP